LTEVANEFNKANIDVGGKPASVKIRNIASGTAVRFEPGEEKEVELVEIGGRKHVYGCNGLTQGSVRNKDAILKRIHEQGFGSTNDT
jgi:urease beta subunit